MKRWILATACGFLAVGLAQNSLSLEAALGKAPVPLNLELARANLASAQQVLSQLQADPTTLKADLLAAQGSLDYAQASLGQAQVQAKLSLAQAYLDALLIQRKQQLDQTRLSLAQTEVKVAQERVRLGSGTAIAVEQAQANLAQVQQDLKSDQAQVGVRQELLQSVLNQTPLPALSEPIPALGPLPTLAEIRQAALSVPTVLQARNTVAAAKLKLEQSQSDFVPQSQRNSAQQAQLAAQLDYQTQVASAQQAASAAYVTALSAKAQVEAAQANLAAQKTAYQTALAQEKAGTVARLQVQPLEQALSQAQFGYLQAQQQAYLAWLNLLLVAPGQPAQGVR